MYLMVLELVLLGVIVLIITPILFVSKIHRYAIYAAHLFI
jgi:membrane protein YdbS with pleckstrin-like domain